MAGLSQGGGVGLALAAWMSAGDAGDSGMDIFGMDIARFGDYAQAGLHERQGPGELQASLPDHLPERGAARRPAAPDDADLRPADGRERRLGRVARPRARAVVPGGRPRAEGGRDLPALERLGVRGRRGRGRARAGRRHGDLELRQVPGDRAGGGSLAVVAPDGPDAAARPDRPDGDAQRGRPDRRRVHRRPPERGRRVLPLRLARRRGPPPALVRRPPAGRRIRDVRGPGPVARRPVDRRPARPGHAVEGHGRGPVQRGVPLHGFPADRGRDHPGARRPDQLQRRARLRAVGRSRIPAGAVRPS